MACNGLQGYINAMADECQALHDSSIASKLTIWLEPLVKVTELISPIASLAGTATGTPLPTELVLGGVRGVLNITKSIPNVQKPAIQLESQIGEKANLLSLYAWALQRNEYAVQKALIMVYSDIAIFCRDVYRLFGKRKKNVIGNFFEKTKMSITNEFSADFEDHVRKFENDFETFQQTRASVHFMKTQQILDTYERRMKEDEDFEKMRQQHQRQLDQLRQEKRLLEQEKQTRKITLNVRRAC